MNPIQEKISLCSTKRLMILDNFLLMKVNDEGRLEWNHDEVEALAKSYDHGKRTDDTRLAKIISLIWRDGYVCAMDTVEEKQQQLFLLVSCVAGHA